MDHRCFLGNCEHQRGIDKEGHEKRQPVREEVVFQKQENPELKGKELLLCAPPSLPLTKNFVVGGLI